MKENGYDQFETSRKFNDVSQEAFSRAISAPENLT